ncbi:MAG TPA: helix-turn-helix domain-containing protein [Streptosporangiaceae bacterium]|nr:helix-turn-helix domain-containing protein [Streptosporangiaceae bacterium]
MPEDRDGVESAGLWLRRRRESAGLTQEELAERAGLATRTLSNLESGRIRRPHSRSLDKLAHALGLSARASDELQARFRVNVSDGASYSWPGESPAAVPRQLPLTVPSFVGRSAEFALLDRWLAEARRNAGGAAIFGIGGMAGVGKTALAVCWAHRVASEFPDGQLYVTLGGNGQVGQSADAAEALGGILVALGAAPERVPATLEDRSRLYRRLAAGRRLLIVIDNAKDASQVRALAPGTAGCMVVMTSRMQLAELAVTDDARLVSLDVLEASEAAQLLSARLSADRARDESQAVPELVALCGRLPLALVIVAARAATTGWRLSLFASQLADIRQRLDALDLGDSITDIRSVFSWSCQQLSPEATRLLRRLAFLPGPDFASTDTTGPGLSELVSASLIAEHQPGRFKLHDLLRLYVAEEASLAWS